jgi:hypothetical protein
VVNLTRYGTLLKCEVTSAERGLDWIPQVETAKYPKDANGKGVFQKAWFTQGGGFWPRGLRFDPSGFAYFAWFASLPIAVLAGTMQKILTQRGKGAKDLNIFATGVEPHRLGNTVR